MHKSAVQIVKTLQKAGHTAYFAGGCVRDILLKREPKDYDIATSAKPEQIEALFEKTIPIGKSFGVITTEHNGHHFEIATFRSDSSTSDGRRPDAIFFSHPAEDAKRRDFTINGLFYDPVNDEIHDFVGGRDDLKNKLVRFIGDPHQRIQEDHLRIIRAIRFKNTLDFGYHPDTYHALKTHSALANKVSQERMREELNKMLMSEQAPVAFEDMQDTGVLSHVLPELEACKGVAQPPEFHHEGDVWTHLMLALKSLPPDAPLSARWATIFHDIGKPETFKISDRIRFDHHSEISSEIAEKIMRRLKFSRREIERVSWTVRHHFMMLELLKMPLGRQRHWFLHPYFPDLLLLYFADAAGTTPTDLSLYERVKDAYENCLEKFPQRPEALLTGEDVMKILGLSAGPKIGQILEEAMHKQLAHELVTREEALDWLKTATLST